MATSISTFPFDFFVIVCQRIYIILFYFRNLFSLDSFVMSSTIPDLEDAGKLFVGGLSPSTTKETLQAYFSHFGEVVDSVVMKNNETGRSRGFGFITYKDPNCLYKVLQIRNHELDGKKIDPKECTPRSMQKVRKQAGKCKIFLGGLPPDITEEAIRSGMSQFGKVDQVVIMYDQETKKCRGFGFLSFELEESIDQACAQRFVIINGKQIECKKAEPRVNPKRLAYDLLKNQNGFVSTPAYVQVPSVLPSNWNTTPSQTYGLQGPFKDSSPSKGPNTDYYKLIRNSPYPGYPAGMVTLNTSSPAYTSVQSLPYMQPYTNFGTPVAGYNYTPVGTNIQPSYSTSSTPIAGVHTTTFTSESEKSFGLGDYAQSPSSYGPSKTSYVGGNANDVSYGNQGVLPTSTAQRYHPY